MIVAGAKVTLTTVTLFACFVAGQRITTIQLDGTQYYISRMNPYSAELNYFLAYEYCRSIGLQLASFETLEKTNSISDFLRNAGYNKFDYWTSGNRLGTDMLIWMSTGLPFNTTFNQMKRSNSGSSGLDNDDLTSKPVLPIARKKRGESGSRDGCVAIKAPNMDWDTADCTDLKDFICEQTRCYYYNYGSIPVSSSQGFNYKQKTTTAPLYSAVSLEQANITTPAYIATSTVTTTTATKIPSPTIFMITTTTEGYGTPSDQRLKPDDTPRVSEAESESTVTSTKSPSAEDASGNTTEQQNYQESQTDEQSTNERADGQYTTELPTLIQMHNQQQHEQQQNEQQLQIGDQQAEEQQRNNAFAFESLEKAFATSVPHKIRSTKDLEQPKDAEADQLPWSWAKDIMLQKPVLKKSSQEVV